LAAAIVVMMGAEFQRLAESEPCSAGEAALGDGAPQA